MKILELYCKKSSRTKTDVIREFIRSLAKSEKEAFMEPNVTSSNQSEPMGSQSLPMANIALSDLENDIRPLIH